MLPEVKASRLIKKCKYNPPTLREIDPSVGEEYNLFGNDNNDERGKDNLRSGDGESLLVASSSNSPNDNDPLAVMTPLLLRITLWAELYKLGESSLDEVFSNLQTLFLTST